MTERLALDVTWLPTAESGRTTSAWRPCRSPVFMGTDGVSAARTSRLPPAMIFVARRIDARVELTKPLDFCCNCGRDADIDLVETPLQRTRFFLVFGTELTVREEFPYCRACRRSAGRVRPGTLSKLLMAALTTSIAIVPLPTEIVSDFCAAVIR